MSVPQFGTPAPGRRYLDRLAAFTVIANDGRIATVRVDFPDGGTRLDLPGGGLDPGETHVQAARRECGEEAGLRVIIGDLVVEADHYFLNEQGLGHNTRGQFFEGRLEGADAGLKTEDDHTLVWMTPQAALLALDRDSHAWAVACWLRRRFARDAANG